MNYFYDQEEKSERINKYHYRMNMAWKFATYAAAFTFCYGCYFHYTQNRDIWTYAGEVVKHADVNPVLQKVEGEKIKITIDGLEIGEVDPLINDCIVYLKTNKDKEQFQFYKEVLKPLILERCDP